MSENNQPIRTRACPQCYLCGARGHELYSRLTDRLFDAPGVWNLKQCPDAACGLIWLDPMPVEEDIALAYRSYYTHQSAGARKSTAALVDRILWGVLARATGLIKEQRAIWYRYLGDQSPGKLLEIGCGAGDYLARMRTLGWIVEGVETDPAACRHARKMYGLTVHEGTLESRGYPDDYFDAIVINHVIEHVFDPVGLLKECHRIVKSDGQVVVITPNVGSWARQKFQESWRGLEPPRHIHIFSSKPLKMCAGMGGFERVKLTSTPANAEHFISSSLTIKNSDEGCSIDPAVRSRGVVRTIIQKSKHFIYSLYEYYLWKSNPEIGEELVMICHK
jgi:2-polyprenyl-3-methyl-5-hydroxy-6-metoxy-1,4-benzoquinol methylase